MVLVQAIFVGIGIILAVDGTGRHAELLPYTPENARNQKPKDKKNNRKVSAARRAPKYRLAGSSPGHQNQPVLVWWGCMVGASEVLPCFLTRIYGEAQAQSEHRLLVFQKRGPQLADPENFKPRQLKTCCFVQSASPPLMTATPRPFVVKAPLRSKSQRLARLENDTSGRAALALLPMPW